MADVDAWWKTGETLDRASFQIGRTKSGRRCVYMVDDLDPAVQAEIQGHLDRLRASPDLRLSEDGLRLVGTMAWPLSDGEHGPTPCFDEEVEAVWSVRDPSQIPDGLFEAVSLEGRIPATGSQLSRLLGSVMHPFGSLGKQSQIERLAKFAERLHWPPLFPRSDRPGDQKPTESELVTTCLEICQEGGDDPATVVQADIIQDAHGSPCMMVTFVTPTSGRDVYVCLTARPGDRPDQYDRMFDYVVLVSDLARGSTSLMGDVVRGWKETVDRGNLGDSPAATAQLVGGKRLSGHPREVADAVEFMRRVYQ